MDGTVAEALRKAGVQPADLDAVAVSIGPGLSMCLRVGACHLYSCLELCPSDAANLAVLCVTLCFAGWDAGTFNCWQYTRWWRQAGIGHAVFADTWNLVAAACHKHGRLPPADPGPAPVPTCLSPLQVGVIKARGLAAQHQLRLVPVHHMEAHALVARLQGRVHFPFLCLLVSGGHNMLLLAHGVGQYTLMGSTLDDAVGKLLTRLQHGGTGSVHACDRIQCSVSTSASISASTAAHSWFPP